MLFCLWFSISSIFMQDNCWQAKFNHCLATMSMWNCKSLMSFSDSKSIWKIHLIKYRVMTTGVTYAHLLTTWFLLSGKNYVPRILNWMILKTTFACSSRYKYQPRTLPGLSNVPHPISTKQKRGFTRSYLGSQERQMNWANSFSPSPKLKNIPISS